MRTPRLKSSSGSAWYHFTARASGYWDEIVFDDNSRANFVRILNEVAELCTVKVLDYAVMGNHVHVIARPGSVLSPQRAANRYNRYYESRFNPSGDLDADSEKDRAAEMAERLADCSYFIKMVLHRFTNWFNAHGPRKRAGRVWSQRYKTTIIEDKTALWSLLQHLALNAYRVGEVKDPAEYDYCAYGQWMATEVHPYEKTFMMALKRMRPDFSGSADEALDLFIDGLVDVLDGEVQQYYEVGGETLPVLVSAKESRRLWTDGGVIGSEKFVRKCITEQFGQQQAKKQRLGAGALPDLTVVTSMRRQRYRPTHGDPPREDA